MSRLFTSIAMSFVFASSLSVCAEEVKVSFLEEGATKKIGGYRPIRSEMDQEASIAKKIPEDFQSPKFGWLKVGDRKYAFALDETEQDNHRLVIDCNADGDLTNDAKIDWQKNDKGLFKGNARLDLGDGRSGKIEFYRFDPEDPSRAQLKNTLLYYTDFGFEYSFELDGKAFSSFVSGELDANVRLAIDRDDNGRISSNLEIVKINAPFNFTGTTYVFAIDKGNLTLNKADTELPQAPLPPDLSLGKNALSFTATTIEGQEVEFPKAYAGKIVMLDFWATWCGPCIGEIPHMKEAYEQWHDKGFEILGVSFDSEGDEEKVKEFLKEKELPWAQIFEGKGWETTIGVQHDVSAIPFVLLVDGDSGKILGTIKELRGEQLAQFIGEQLAQKSGKTE